MQPVVLRVALRAETVAKKTGSPEDAALADFDAGSGRNYMLADHTRAPKTP